VAASNGVQSSSDDENVAAQEQGQQDRVRDRVTADVRVLQRSQFGDGYDCFEGGNSKADEWRQRLKQLRKEMKEIVDG
jgi:hypothetical protein